MKKTDLPNFWRFFEKVTGKEREPPEDITEADGRIEEDGKKQRKQK